MRWRKCSRKVVLIPKIINYEAEDDVTPDVAPWSQGMLAMVIPLCVETLFEQFVCKNAGLGETIHAHSNFNIYPALVIAEVVVIVFLDNFVEDEIKVKAHILVFLHGRHEVEIQEVHSIEFCIGGQNC